LINRNNLTELKLFHNEKQREQHPGRGAQDSLWQALWVTPTSIQLSLENQRTMGWVTTSILISQHWWRWCDNRRRKDQRQKAYLLSRK